MKQYGFGVDIGGTTCKIGLFDMNGTILEKWEIKTNTDPGQRSGKRSELYEKSICTCIGGSLCDRTLRFLRQLRRERIHRWIYIDGKGDRQPCGSV